MTANQILIKNYTLAKEVGVTKGKERRKDAVFIKLPDVVGLKVSEKL